MVGKRTETAEEVKLRRGKGKEEKQAKDESERARKRDVAARSRSAAAAPTVSASGPSPTASDADDAPPLSPRSRQRQRKHLQQRARRGVSLLPSIAVPADETKTYSNKCLHKYDNYQGSMRPNTQVLRPLQTTTHQRHVSLDSSLRVDHGKTRVLVEGRPVKKAEAPYSTQLSRRSANFHQQRQLFESGGAFGSGKSPVNQSKTKSSTPLSATICKSVTANKDLFESKAKVSTVSETPVGRKSSAPFRVENSIKFADLPKTQSFDLADMDKDLGDGNGHDTDSGRASKSCSTERSAGSVVSEEGEGDSPPPPQPPPPHVTVVAIGERARPASLHFARFGPVSPIGRPLDVTDESGCVDQPTAPSDDGGGDEARVLGESVASLGAEADEWRVFWVALRRDDAPFQEGSVGLILTASTDSSNHILVQRVINGGLADRDGRVERGDRLLAVGGQRTAALSPGDARRLLKAPSPVVRLLLAHRLRPAAVDAPISTPFKRPDALKPLDLSPSEESDRWASAKYSSTPVEVAVEKSVLGIGLSLGGGANSPLGNRPLIIKRLFKGGAAERTGRLREGDRLQAVGGVDVAALSHLQACQLLKRSPDGPLQLRILPRI